MARKTGKSKNNLYRCPHELYALRTTFPSLRADLGACAGATYEYVVVGARGSVIGRAREYFGVCASCEHYVNNAQARDKERLSAPVSRSGRR